ncbi:MAG: phage tail tape measure protein [Sneathiella sp.]
MSASLSAPIAAFGALTINSAVQFESAMNKVEALSGETGNSLNKLRDLARDLGESTAFSATQAAEAMSFLSMAGWDANQVMAGTPAILNLAASSGIELGRAADIASNIMGQFKIQAKDAARVSDVLAAATSSANVDMEMLAESFKYAGPVAKSFGMSLEETVAAVGMLGNIGIQGSSAGTALKNSMLQLVNPATDAAKMMKKLGVETIDAQGNLLPFSQIIADFGDKVKTMGSGNQLKAIEMLFGKISMAGATELISKAQTGELQKFAETLRNVDGRAKSMSNTLMKGAPGAVKRMASAFEGMMLAIADSGLIDWFTDVTEALTRFIKYIAQSDSSILKWGTVITGIVAVSGPFLIAIGLIASGMGTLLTAIKLLNLALLANPIVAVITAIAVAVAAAAYLIYDNWDKIVGYFTDKFDAVVAAFDKGFLQGIYTLLLEFNPFLMLFDYYDGLIAYLTGFDLAGSIQKQMEAIASVIDEYNPFPVLMASMDKLIAAFESLDLSGMFMNQVTSLAGQLPDWATGILEIGSGSASQPVQQNSAVENIVAGSGGRARDARAKVDVNFAGVPRGTRINSNSSGEGLDFTAGIGYERGL